MTRSWPLPAVSCRSLIGLALIGVLLMVTAACSREQRLICERPALYRSADSGGRIAVPDDLSVPDESEALAIPDPSAPLDSGPIERCLEFSPAYSQQPSDDEQDG